MKIILASLVIGSLMVGTALAQTSATSQSGVAASDNTSVSAGKSGSQVSSNTSTNTAANTTITKSGRQGAAARPSGLTLETSHSRPRGTSPELSLLAPAPVED